MAPRWLPPFSKKKKKRWLPPPSGFAKVNVDTALVKNSIYSAAAAVAKYEAGNFMRTTALVLEGLTNAEVVEAVARREGLALAKDLAPQKIRVASNCVNAVRCIRGEDLGPYGPIVQEIKAIGS